MATVNTNGVGIFGGTFDPVHIGHLRTAVELRKVLNLTEMRLVPSAIPPHRSQPQANAKQRMAMLKLALGYDTDSSEPGLVVGDRELHRQGPSYTVDTLRDIRQEIGTDAPLCLCIGMDSLVNLNQWHQWSELTDIAHIVVAARPGWHLPNSGEIVEFVKTHRATQTEQLQSQPSGKVLILEMTLLPVSATGIRQSLQKQQSIRYLVPDQVIDYIRQHQLYEA